MSASSSAKAREREPTIVSQPSERETAVSRLFRAPREKVFHMFTHPSQAANVWSPDPTMVSIERMDVRPGGRYSIVVKLPDGKALRFTGEYREFVPPRRVVNTFEVDSMPGVVAIETDEFLEEGDFTRVSVRWKYESRADRDKMAGPEMEKAVAEMWDHVADLLGSA